jgi:phosphoribosylanthranilate isomerase
MRYKVCGMTRIEQMHRLNELGVQFIGFIFYPGSPRYVFKHGLTGSDIRKAKLSSYKIGVFVNASHDEIMKQVDDFGLDMVQLHGHETPFFCDKISSYIQVIRAFRFAEGDHVEWMVKDFYDCTDMFMLDTGITLKQEGERFKGRGRMFNWNRLRGLNVNKPFFLSGGIEPTDVQSVKEFLLQPTAKDLFAIDINSRFETAPGIKDMEKIKRFMDAINNG